MNLGLMLAAMLVTAPGDTVPSVPGPVRCLPPGGAPCAGSRPARRYRIRRGGSGGGRAAIAAMVGRGASVGVGARWRLADEGARIRLDYALGRRGSGLYLTVGEAF